MLELVQDLPCFHEALSAFVTATIAVTMTDGEGEGISYCTVSNPRRLMSSDNIVVHD